MEDKELIKQLREFSRIKPDKKWVLLSKTEIFQKEEGVSNKFIFPWKIFIPAFSIASLLLLAIYFQADIKRIPSEIANLSKNFSLSYKKEDQKTAQISESIKAINEDLNKVAESLGNLKENKDQIDKKQILGITQIAKTTAQNSKEVAKKIENTSDIKKQDDIPQILTVLVETSDKITQKSDEIQKETVKALISDLEQRSLNPEDRQKLEKAKSYFEKDDIQSAIILLSQIGSY